MMKTVEEWGEVQAQWLYLLPIFSSEDIVNQMPTQGKLFQEVDKVYRGLMNAVLKNPKVIVTSSASGVYESLLHCVENLEMINDGVAAYLETKRLYFPRFFFLSNDEMLEILSETKDPLRVQPHLKKCFEGIAKLGFDADLNIYSMFSGEGEEISMVENISTVEARGSVEIWLVQKTSYTGSTWEEIETACAAFAEDTFANVALTVVQHTQKCVDAPGGHFEQLLQL
ncbi:Dynein heavy chain 12, axonemal [Periplaneta americana]|uniref:Dynein heavy chain 12, axonemal n=1 Tax=Periplaneta americana TaxID=6978 RepID=A0ABQ8RWD3_PERAM|nr:Dynein heavy chain 12, axonemal [Periplaneta americana]